MKFTTIYKNGKPDYFFVKLDDTKEFAFVQPYFFVTTYDKTRHGRIKNFYPIFAGAVYAGKQTHGYGYSASADVYGEFIAIIKKLYGEKLSAEALAELDGINTHDSEQQFSEALLDELQGLNLAELYKR